MSLGQTQPTIGRHISALEAALQVTLFERTGRSIILTQSGADLVDHVRTMARGADLISLAASGRSQVVEGLVRITASEFTAAYVLPPILDALIGHAPRLEIRLVAENEIRDIVRRQADIAIRHARPDQPNLIARRLPDDVMRFRASPAYLACHEAPAKADLSDHRIVGHVEAERMLGNLRPLGLGVTRETFRITTSSQIAALRMARLGLGLIVLPDRVAAAFPD